MKELQKFSKVFQKEMNWEINPNSYLESKTSLLNNYMLLTTEVAEAAEEMRKAFNISKNLINQGINEERAFELAKKEIKEDMGKELADCLAYICKIANFFEVDLEDSFYRKMEEVKNRINKDI